MDDKLKTRFHQLRITRGLTLRDMAEVTGKTLPCYSRYERGKSDPSLETLITLADFFGVSIDYLVGRGK